MKSLSERKNKHNDERNISSAHDRSKHPVDRQDRVHSQPEMVTVRSKNVFPSDKSIDSFQRVATTTDLYIVDRKGDSQNLNYGSLSKYSIPRHRSAGSGRILGLDGRFRIGNEGIQDVSSDSGVRNKHIGKSLLSNLAIGGGEPVRTKTKTPDDGPDAVASQSDYVAIGDRRGRKRRLVQKDTQSDKATDIHAGNPSRTQSGRESVSSSSSDDGNGGSNPSATIQRDIDQRRLLELERKSREDPHDTENWLSLIAHQEAIKRTSHGSPPSTDRFLDLERSSLAELKISIYERGLDNLPDNEGREMLLIGMMTEGEKVWDTKKLFSKWEMTLNEFFRRSGKHSRRLWSKYLDTRQTSFGTFSVESCLTIYQQCQQLAIGIDKTEENDEWRISSFLRATNMLTQAGFTERAVAMWQGEIEWVYYAPEEKTINQEKEYNRFEEWWQSEAPRFGEDGSKGWKCPVTRNFQAANAHQDYKRPEEGQNSFELWAIREEQQSALSKKPARALDEISDDDPYRIVLFSDIEGFLFRPVCLEGRKLLLDAFLQFCSLPPLAKSTRYPGLKCWTDPFVRAVDIELQVHDAQKPESNSEALSETPPLANFAIDSATLFADTRRWFAPWPSPCTNHQDNVDQNWLRRSIRQLVEIADDEILTEYAIALELRTNLPNVRKYAKALLKKQPGRLRLYNAFALVECRTGALEAAENVWATALSMSQSLHPIQRKDTLLMWRSWTWELIDRNDFGKAEALILTIPDGKVEITALEKFIKNPIPVSTQVRAQRYLETQLLQSLQRSEHDETVHVTDLLALLCYLTTNHDMQMAQRIYQSTLDALSIGNPSSDSPTRTTEELIYQSLARLTHLHATFTLKTSSNPPSKAIISSIFSTSLRLFPNNTIFLALSNHHTRRPQLLDRLRSSILPNLYPPLNPDPHTLSPSDPSIIQSLFNLTTELRRPTYAGRTVHSVRAAFSRVLDPPSPFLLSSSTNKSSNSNFISNPSLHLARLDWELSLLTPSTAATATAKSTIHLRRAFHAALQAIPWCKALYLKAFTAPALRAVVGGKGDGEEGLRELYETMMEKGLRIFQEL